MLSTSLSLSAAASCLPLPTIPKFPLPTSTTFSRFSLHLPRCSLCIATEPSPSKEEEERRVKPSLAEVSRTIMELASVGTLSTTVDDGWPLGIGARFVVDAQGLPALCLNDSERFFQACGNSSFHVGFEQSGLRTPQCTILGSLNKTEDESLLKRLCTKWERNFGEEVDKDFLYVISVERVLLVENFNEGGLWVNSLEYINAEPDPLRNFAAKIVNEMNSVHSEEVRRLCNIYVDTEFQVRDTKMIWVDRLGFDLYVYSGDSVFAVRIPFPSEVTDEKGVKSSFNSMSHLAWEIEKNYTALDFEKVKTLKKIR
ncbi:FMN-binding split barrel-containing protein [Dioscorea alata]|uniref:FMN-binding split barrel-containing protein n=1 Tax=Dioscorea alata TaxID=55571 RepID=A0ACB7W3W0_DIOAL|nr:FMN-binding split barrel-containing protein [Dioscorea alata]